MKAQPRAPPLEATYTLANQSSESQVTLARLGDERSSSLSTGNERHVNDVSASSVWAGKVVEAARQRIEDLDQMISSWFDELELVAGQMGRACNDGIPMSLEWIDERRNHLQVIANHMYNGEALP